jgi:hypothetical protein
MSKQTQGQGQGLAGTQPYGTVAGARHVGNGRADYHGQGVELAPPSGVAYGGVHYGRGLCQAMNSKEEECKAPKAKGTDYCIGHLRSMNKIAENQDAALDPKE